eukprot:767309-Hanusia_phi.AAC.2
MDRKVHYPTPSFKKVHSLTSSSTARRVQCLSGGLAVFHLAPVADLVEGGGVELWVDVTCALGLPGVQHYQINRYSTVTFQLTAVKRELGNRSAGPSARAGPGRVPLQVPGGGDAGIYGSDVGAVCCLCHLLYELSEGEPLL